MMYKSYLSALPRLLVALLLVLFITGCEIFTPITPDPKPDDPLPEPQSCSASNNELELVEASLYEQELACLIVNHPEQQRPEMHYHPTLGEIARRRAEDMAENGFYKNHVDHRGYGPDWYVCEAGYVTSQDWCYHVTEVNPKVNTIENIGVQWNESWATPENLFLAWYESPPHRDFMLGEVESTYFGIGHAYTESSPEFPDKPGNYWVFIAAHPPEEPNMTSGSGSY